MNLEVNLGGMQLSSCEEVAGLLRRRSVSRLRVGGCFRGQGVAPCQDYHGMIMIGIC